MAVPPSVFRGRLLTTTYLFEDPAHPDRVTGQMQSPTWTEDDRALLLGLAEYESTFCPGGCGKLKEIAWHDYSQEEYVAVRFMCHACTARQDGTPAVYSVITDGPSPDKAAKFPPFELGKTTTEPPSKGAA